MASATQSGMLWVTRMNSTANGPMLTRSRGRTGTSGFAPVRSCSASFGSTSASVRGGAPFLLQVRQIRNDPVHPQQLGVGEHDACIDENRRLAAREREHVHAEL